jgi:hypothetical protein
LCGYDSGSGTTVEGDFRISEMRMKIVKTGVPSDIPCEVITRRTIQVVLKSNYYSSSYGMRLSEPHLDDLMEILLQEIVCTPLYHIYLP